MQSEKELIDKNPHVREVFEENRKKLEGRRSRHRRPLGEGYRLASPYSRPRLTSGPSKRSAFTRTRRVV